MKLILFIYTALIISSQLNAQVHYDSINNKDFLYENSYLSSSNNILNAYFNGISIENITVTESDNLGLRNKDSITSIELKENRLSIVVHKKDVGCKKFIFEISIVNDSLLNLLYYDFGNPCISSSNYFLNYNLILDKSKIENLKRIKYIIVNNNIGDKRKVKLLE